MPHLYAQADRDGHRHAVRPVFVGQDDKSPDRYVTGLVQAGIGMPDRDYYLSPDPKLAEDPRANISQHLTNVLTLAGEPNAAARAKAILDFETAGRQGPLDPDRKPRRDQDL